MSFEHTHAAASKNVRFFLLFRVLYNARFYYPVFGVLFLDMGLTLQQFALLNVVWAVTIVLLEVPSGALADQIGRKRMVIIAAFLMVCEMVLIAFVPLGNPELIFWVLVINRVLSGASEAAASGADEALAYDSLLAVNREKEWPRVLRVLGQLQSLGFFCAMLLGAALYDSQWLNGLFGWSLDPETTLRFPLYATLLTSLVTLAAALALKEPDQAGEPQVTVRTAIKQTLASARWVIGHRVVLCVILASLVLDSGVRLFITLQSNYLRAIELPEASFGLIGASFALLGAVAAPIAEWLVNKQGRVKNFLLLACFAFSGLWMVSQVWPTVGLLGLIPLGMSMSFLGFFVSHYINQDAPPRMRATVLSLRGLSNNFAYGVAGLWYSFLSAQLRENLGSEQADSAEVFTASLMWLPWIYLALYTITGLLCYLLLRRHRIEKAPVSPGGFAKTD